MKYIFLIAAFNALFFSVLLFQKKPKATHDKVLTFWLLYLAFLTGTYGLFSDELFTFYPVLSGGFISLFLLHGPFLFLYISSLISDSGKLKRTQIFHFVPFLLFNLYLLGASFSPGVSQRLSLNHAESAGNMPVVFSFFLILTVLSGPVYFLLSVRLFRKLDVNIFTNFSFLENVNLSWLRKLVYLFGGVWTALMIFAVIHHIFKLYSWSFCTNGLTLSLSVFIILIGYYGLNQREIFTSPEKETYVTARKQEKYAGSALNEADVQLYFEKLTTYMATEKPYLDPELRLQQLAEKLDIQPHHLSRVINEKVGKNFFDFVNSYRIEEVKAKIADPDFRVFSLLGIAFESGFNSKSAFNRVFKKITNVTPTQYKNSLRKP